MKDLKQNQKDDVIVGRNPVSEAIRSSRTIDRILVTKGGKTGTIVGILAKAKEKQIPIKEVDSKKLDFLAGNENHQGIIAMAAVKEYSSVEEARAAYKAATSAIATKEYRRYMQPTEEELRAILKAVKEDCAPNSEIKKTTIGGVVRKTIIIVDTYQIGNYKIDATKTDGIDFITIYNIPDRM